MEKQLATKIGKLSPQKSKGGFFTAYSYQPEEFLEKQHGSLFFIVEIASPSPSSSEIGEMIIEVIKEEYYSDLNRDPLSSLESALKSANEELGLVCEQGETDWLGKLNIICGVLAGENFHLTCVGSAEAYLVRNEKITHVSKGLSTPSNASSYPLKTFANIASGDIEPKDKIILSSPGLFYYVSLEKLRKIVTENDPAKAISQLAKFLETEDGVGEISALILEINTVEAISQETVEEEIYIEEPKSKIKSILESVKTKNIPKKIKLSFLKIGSLILTIGKTSSNFLKSKIIPNVKNSSNKIKSELKKGTENIKDYRKEQTLKKEIEQARIEEANMEEKKIEQINQEEIKTQEQEQIEKVEEHPQEISQEHQEKKSSKIYQNFTSSFQEGYKIFKQKIKNISFDSIKKFKPTGGSKKLFLFLTTCLIVFFLLSTIGFAYKRKRDTKFTQLDNIYTQAVKKQKDAKNLLIYDDRNEARGILNEALSLTDQLIQENYKIAQVKGLKDSIYDELDKVNGVTRISNPEILGDFSQTGADEITTSRILLIDNELYSFNPEINIIYKLNLETKEPKIVFDKTPARVENFQEAYVLNKNILIYDQTSGINIFDSYDNSFTQQTLPLGQKWSRIKDFALYGNNLYLLCPEENQIFVHFKTWQGYSKGWDYIDEETDLNNAVSIAIPGEVLVLKSDGTILKFSRGYQQDFTITNMPDPLNEPTEIFTDTDTKNIYIVDSNNKRIVVLDYEGKFINQYVCEDFDNITGIHINETTSTMYILNNNKVYNINIESSLVSTEY